MGFMVMQESRKQRVRVMLGAPPSTLEADPFQINLA